MKELLILSGKGGTGKTTITAALAVLYKDKIIADYDVDAPDLHILLKPEPITIMPFYSGFKAKILQDKCVKCGTCLEICNFEAITIENNDYFVKDTGCEGCGVCIKFCPENAIVSEINNCGEWFISETPFGIMAHAQLGIGEENSGKLVSTVKKIAKDIAKKNGINFIISDGPPGIGCPVISSISGVNLVLIVTEPTLSGLHDLNRVKLLADHFKVPSFVCINKFDINLSVSKEIENWCEISDSEVISKIPFDHYIDESIKKGIPITLYNKDAPSSKEIELMAHKIENILKKM